MMDCRCGKVRTLAVLTMAALLGGEGCAVQTRPVPAEAHVHSFALSHPTDAVFRAALSAAQRLNLDVTVLERESGFIRFDAATLGPAQLDQYCTYPFVIERTGEPFDTFQGWSQRSIKGGRGAIHGKVTLTLLVASARSGEAVANLRSNMSGGNANEVYPCVSTGKLERDFEAAVRGALSATQ